MVLALQVQARRHGVRRGLAAAGRLRQDRRHDRRKSRYGADETARPARRVPRQTGVAAFSGNDRRHRDEHPAGRGHLLRHLLHVGRKIFRQRRRRLRLHLQHGGTGARLRERRQNHLDRRRADRRRERHRHDAAADRERPHGRRRARRPRRALHDPLRATRRLPPLEGLRRDADAAHALPHRQRSLPRHPRRRAARRRRGGRPQRRTPHRIRGVRRAAGRPQVVRRAAYRRARRFDGRVDRTGQRRRQDRRHGSPPRLPPAHEGVHLLAVDPGRHPAPTTGNSSN